MRDSNAQANTVLCLLGLYPLYPLLHLMVPLTHGADMQQVSNVANFPLDLLLPWQLIAPRIYAFIPYPPNKFLKTCPL